MLFQHFFAKQNHQKARRHYCKCIIISYIYIYIYISVKVSSSQALVDASTLRKKFLRDRSIEKIFQHREL